MRKRQIRSLGQDNPLEEGMATNSNILAWRIPWTEEPRGYRSWGRKELDMIETIEHTCTHQRSPVLEKLSCLNQSQSQPKMLSGVAPLASCNSLCQLLPDKLAIYVFHIPTFGGLIIFLVSTFKRWILCWTIVVTCYSSNIQNYIQYLPLVFPVGIAILSPCLIRSDSSFQF